MSEELVFTARRASGEPPHVWMRRYSALRMKFAVALAVVALVVGGIVWLANQLFSIRPGKGTPIGLCVRTGAHIATWIQTLEPYVPSLHRDASQDRYTLSVLLVPLDGGEPRLVPVHHGLTPNQFALARILGSDGRSLWVEANGTSKIDLQTAAVGEANTAAPEHLDGQPVSRLTPNLEDNLAAGYVVGERQWLGLHSAKEVLRDYGARKFVRRIVRAENTRDERSFHRASLEPDSSGKYFRVTGIESIGAEQYVNAAFLRAGVASEPLRLHAPEGALMVFTSSPGPAGTLVVARTDDAGHLLWQTDTGIDRFSLQQILVGASSTAWVGTRPRQPDRVPEPLLVIVDHQSGRPTVCSLWR